ncbi:hypothetical protein PY247_10565 [Acinetobacter proteolyticus]|nr:hypothetical protein [Acinetobacter proteolyticus]WEI20115.1 hypothetical protein PY247_10565 [Acinetobacter proteolyticus]
MKKPITIFNGFDSWHDGDYKLEYLIKETVQNFESVDKWLYLGADIGNPLFAKIGITKGDLSSRSYSSANPNYHIFCAFKFIHNISKEEIEAVESHVLSRMDSLFIKPNGTSTRMYHYESQAKSECYFPVDFFQFYKLLHYEILTNHRNFFVICDYEMEYAGVVGEFVSCIFNPRRVINPDDYIQMIIQ